MSGQRISGEHIRELRARAVMSRWDLVRKSGVGYSTLANLETGYKKRATPSIIRKLAYGLGVDATELVCAELEAAS